MAGFHNLINGVTIVSGVPAMGNYNLSPTKFKSSIPQNAGYFSQQGQTPPPSTNEISVNRSSTNLSNLYNTHENNNQLIGQKRSFVSDDNHLLAMYPSSPLSNIAVSTVTNVAKRSFSNPITNSSPNNSASNKWKKRVKYKESTASLSNKSINFGFIYQ